eukprot:TRINITY_DN2661_c0_g1_i1.p1 TRINITY_DN2661_c0_g1~~TRINITY_DN2661_c0_g1_i1.p1  ORF type:complete len:568 (+),score=151.02 TRINITY_DN2661_c0_g1_i1:51-1754(+)
MFSAFGIQKVSEGFDSDQNIPVEVSYKDVIEWLTDRRKLKKEWNVNYRNLRSRVDKAQKELMVYVQQQLSGIQDEDGLKKNNLGKIVEILKKHDEQDSGLNYSQVKETFELLLTVENNDKSLLGNYNSAKLKEWSGIIKTYESDNLSLAEASQLLNSNIKYIIPSMKDEINKTTKQIDECERKKNDCLRSAKEFKNKYALECEKSGVAGNDVRSELEEMRINKNELNESLNILVQNLITSPKQKQTLEDAIQLYNAFISFILSYSSPSHPQEVSVCDTLKHVLNHGNLESNSKINDSIQDSDSNPSDNKPQINWDITVEEDDNNNNNNDVLEPKINWDITVEEDSEVLEPKIDWNVEESESNNTNTQPEIKIDWDTFEVQSEGTDASNTNNNTKVKSKTFLENTENRNQFINDLYELHSFLTQRLKELSSTQSSSSFISFTGLKPSVIEAINTFNTTTRIRDLIEGVKTVVDAMNEERLQRLMEIASSQKYCERLANSINTSLNMANNLVSSSVQNENKKIDLERKVGELEPRLKRVVEQNRKLKQMLEEGLGALVERRVNITQVPN